MNAIHRLALLPLALLLAASASAQNENAGSMEEGRKAAIGEPAPPLRVRTGSGRETKVENVLERHRRKLVILFFYRSNDPASNDAAPILKKIAGEYGKRGVSIIPITDEKKEKADAFVKAKELSGEYLAQVDMEFPYNVSAPPRIYLIDPDGILVNHFHPADRLEERVKEAMRRNPPAGADPETIRRLYERAEAALKAEQVGRAYGLALEVEQLTDKETSVGQNVRKLKETVEKAAREKLDAARKAFNEKKYDEALPRLAELSVRFAGTPLGTDADTEVSRVMGERDQKSKMRAALDEARAQVIFDRASDHEADGRFMDAIRAHREIMDRYPDSELAKKSETAVDRISADPKVQAQIAAERAEAEAERWFDIAERFAKAGMNAKAREYYGMVQEKHPKSRAAARVAERLKALPADEPDEDTGGDEKADEEAGEEASGEPSEG